VGAPGELAAGDQNEYLSVYKMVCKQHAIGLELDAAWPRFASSGSICAGSERVAPWWASVAPCWCDLKGDYPAVRSWIKAAL
jgi:hypothetical protein